MKKIKLITLFIAFTALMFSCSDDEKEPTAKSITISASSTTVEEKSEKITLSVKTDLGEDVTDECKFYSNDKELANNFFNPDKVGKYVIKAVYKKLTSNEITITVKQKVIPIKAITLTASETAVTPKTKITFSVKADNGKDVTAESKITVDGKAVENATFTPTKDGTYKVKATYKQITSNEVTVTAKSVMDGIIISADHNRVEPGQEITFTVKGNDGSELTDKAKIFVNGKELSKPSFKTDVEGKYKAKATYDKYTSNEISFKVKDPIFSMTLSADFTTVGLNQKVTFTARANTGENIIDRTVLYINGKPIDTPYFIPTAFGKYKAQAIYKDKVKSNELEISVEDIQGYQWFPVVEDYTATWCGYCPRVAYAIEQLEKKTDKAIPIAIHSGDVMATSLTKKLMNAFEVKGFPTAKINRDKQWAYPEPSNLNQVINIINNKAADLGVALSSKVEGNNINVTVKVQAGKDLENTKLVVYLLESGIKADQSNYTSYYGGKKKIKNFEHNHVLRAAFTDVLGDPIPNDQTKKGNVYTKDLSISIPGNVKDINKTDIVAIVVKSDKKALNARTVKTGEAANDFVTK